MTVLIEGLSVVMRNSALDEKFPGGSKRVQDGLRDDTICFDEDLTGIHLSSSDEVGAFVRCCESAGLIFLANGVAVDMVVVDQRTGPTTDCDWIQYSRVPFNDSQSDGHIAVCWLGYGRNQHGTGTAVPGLKFNVAMPVGWSFLGSLSESHRFTPD
jgi:hypothetical protein